MREELIEIGDRVWVELDSNSEYNLPQLPAARKEAFILGFGVFYCGRVNQLLPPGVYRSRSKVKVCFENGFQCFVDSDCIYPIDREEYSRRIDALCQDRRSFEEKAAEDFLCNLPDTLFWEGDLVGIVGGYLSKEGFNPENEIFIVEKIYYEPIGCCQGDFKKWPIYLISNVYQEGLRRFTSDDKIELIERGRIWKFFHQEKIFFGSLEEEIDFLFSIGRARQVRNPKSGSYEWSREEIAEGLESGIVHNYRIYCGVLDDDYRILAERFLDEDFGRKVAKNRLEIFNSSS